MNLRSVLGSTALLIAGASVNAQGAENPAASTLVATNPTASSENGGTSAVSPEQASSVSGSQPSAVAPSEGLAEVVVTAQRQSQNVLSVPASITATLGTQLQTEGIDQMSELQFNTPGFLPVSGVGYTQVYIRGIGNNLFVGADPSVVTNIDDVPRIYGSLVNNLVNVDRVEVLKGAQGGLYGRNATGGVINIITRQPGDTAEADARVSYGNLNTWTTSVYGNLPINDMISWNVSFEKDGHEDYVDNLAIANPLTPAMFPNGGGPVLGALGVTTPAQTAAFFNSAINPQRGYGNQDFWSGDTKLKFQILPNLKVTLDADYSRKHDSDGDQWVVTTPAYAQASDAAILGSFGITAALPPGFYKYPSRNFEDYNSTPAADFLNDYGGSIKPEWSLPGVDLTNILAYRRQKTYYEENYGDPLTVDVPIVSNSKWYVYEELRAVSDGDGPFHFLGGATYLRDHVNYSTTNLLYPPIYTAPIPSVAAATDTLTLSTDDVRNWSVYGQVGYDLTQELNLTVSGRYIHETNSAAFTSPVISTAQIDASKFLPSAVLSYKLEGGGNIYARYAKGFKAGGVNPIVPPNFFPTDYGKVFGPEQVNTYEVGFKDALFDQHMQVTTALFYNDYTGLQYETNGNAANPAIIEAIINAGSARTYGVDQSVTWRLISPLTVGANAAYLNARYKDFKNTDGSVLNTFDFSDRQLVNAPRWQAGFTADLDQPLNEQWHLTGTWLTSYTGTIISQYSTFPGLEDGVISQFWLTNARIGVKSADDRYQLSLFANNLFNRGYFTSDFLSTLGNEAVWGNPRIYGVEFQLRYH